MLTRLAPLLLPGVEASEAQADPDTVISACDCNPVAGGCALRVTIAFVYSRQCRVDPPMVRIEQVSRARVGGNAFIQRSMPAQCELEKLLVRSNRLLWAALLLQCFGQTPMGVD